MMMFSRLGCFMALMLSASVLQACQTIATSATPVTQSSNLVADKQLSVGAKPHGIAAVGGYVYNADTGAAQISVIDVRSDEVVTRVAMKPGGTPGYIQAFRDGRHALALDTARGVLLVIDPLVEHQVVQEVPVGKGPDKMVIASNDRDVYVSLTGESQVVALQFDADRSQAPTRKSYSVGAVAGGAFKHRAIAAGGSWLVVPNSADNHTSLINTSDGSIRLLKDGNDPGPVALGQQFGRPTVAMIGYKTSNTVGLFDLADGSQTSLSGLGQTPSDVAVDTELKRAFFSMTGSNEVAVIDYEAKTVLGRIPVGKRPVHTYMAPEWSDQAVRSLQHVGMRGVHEVWVGNDDDGTVSVIDSEAMRVKATIQTGAGHHKMTFWGHKAYVSNMTDNTVSVIDRAVLP
jgi:YVTN family beta-propeller protein